MSPRGAVVAEAEGLIGRSRPKLVPAPLPDRIILASVSRLKGAGLDPQYAEGDRVNVRMSLSVDARLAFGPGPPAFGGDLVAKLRGLRTATAQTLDTICSPRLF